MSSSRPLRLVAVLTCTIALGCAGQGSEQLGELLGTAEARMARRLTLEELEKLPSLAGIDLDAPLTEADYALWEDHMQAYYAYIVGPDDYGIAPERMNALFNRYRIDVAEIVGELRTGKQTPEEVLRFLTAVRSGVLNEFRYTDLLNSEGREWFDYEYETQRVFWNRVGFDNAEMDMLAEVVRKVEISGPQAADYIDLAIKTTIVTDRVMNPMGEVFTAGYDREYDSTEDENEELNHLGEDFLRQAREILTPMQLLAAISWQQDFDRRQAAWLEAESDMYAAQSKAARAE